MVNMTQLKAALPRELLASVVVFLVALPLCMGIAIASGMPPAKGLITGIIGGIVVGFLAGSPLQVSGPAAGLAVLVFELVRQHGMAMLGPILLLAGFCNCWLGACAWDAGSVSRRLPWCTACSRVLVC